MRRTLSYADALKMLGHSDSLIMRWLDRVSSLGLIAAGAIDLIDARSELIRIGDGLVRGARDLLRGTNRLRRTERLWAAHTIIVVTAYFDALRDALEVLPATGESHELWRFAELTADDQISLASGRPAEVNLRALPQALLDLNVPMPESQRSYEATLKALRVDFYIPLSHSLSEFLSGLALWDALSETEKANLKVIIRDRVPDDAILRYNDMFQGLVTDCPEFALWANLISHQATRTEIRHGLEGLEWLLQALASGKLPSERRHALVRAYQAALDKPITPTGDVPADLKVPSLREGYVDPHYRAARASISDPISQASWWGSQSVRDDAYSFFAAYLTSPQAQRAPLIVLGQPGSGKSVLSRVLAARLPANDFLPIRVELRKVHAETDLQDQIELAIRQSTGEVMPWPRLVEAADGALPVIFLDGFDELLQATGMAQTDYLERVAKFQEREADQERPVAVVVTSRTAVAGRARLPQDTVAVHLEPFDNIQIADWLDIWNRHNLEPLRSRGLSPLPVDTVLHHLQLAQQPLLLLMLALYDADANSLQLESANLSRTELYQRILEEFASREVGKHEPDLTDSQLSEAARIELYRLAIAAFGMFNRGSQWVTESDLETDLAAIIGKPVHNAKSASIRSSLTASQVLVGRFFFIHKSQATRDGSTLQTYEFLHATFGEFLVARLTALVLEDMLAKEEVTRRSLVGGSENDDSLLHALLSFSPLTSRGPTISFITDLLNQIDSPKRSTLLELITRLHRQALQPRFDSAYDAYEPRSLSVTARHAVWSANLLLLAVLVGEGIAASQLFGPDVDVIGVWQSHASLWRSQFTGNDWSGFVYEIAPIRTRDENGNRDLILKHRADSDFSGQIVDMAWSFNIALSDDIKIVSHVDFRYAELDQRIRESDFMCALNEDLLSHSVQPAFYYSAGSSLYFISEGQFVSADHALLSAWLSSYRSSPELDMHIKRLAYALIAVADHGGAHWQDFLEAAQDVLSIAAARGNPSVDSLAKLRLVTNTLAKVTNEKPMTAAEFERLRYLVFS